MQQIFETELLIRRKRRALAHPVDGADFLMRRACEDLGDRLATVERRFTSAAALFCVTPDVAQTLSGSGKVESVLRVEADMGFVAGPEDGVVAPAETVPLPPANLDLAVSVLALQDVNDLPGMLVQIRRALRPDGLFLGAMAGGATLHELRECLLAAEAEQSGGVTPRVSPFADVRDIGGLLQRAGFALPVADVETVTVRYADMFALMRDLRAMGATNALVARSRRFTARRLFLRAAELYAERFSDADGRVRATFSILWMSGWAPDPSQQKPLKPGSAKASLARTLGANEA